MKHLESSKRILLFDLYYGGHHAQYIEQIVHEWSVHWSEHELIVAAGERLIAESPPLEKAQRDAQPGLVIRSLGDVEVHAGAPVGLLRNELAHRRHLRQVLDELRPDHCVLMYFDHVQLSLALDLRFAFPVRLSGIYFRPTFHYKSLLRRRPSLIEKLQDTRKKVIVQAALRNPHLACLFCLDPYAAEHVANWRTAVRAVTLPDGVDMRYPARDPAAVRGRWSVQPGRSVALMFGVIDSRKGVSRVLRALEILPVEIQERLCLALVGPQADDEKEAIAARVQRARKVTRVQVVSEDRFILQDEVPEIVAASDLIVLTYQRHVGSSNVLVRAAAAQRPVLGPEYGLVGEYIRRHRLGMAIDASRPEAIAKALSECVADATPSFDAESAACFAADHTAARFAGTVIRTILDDLNLFRP